MQNVVKPAANVLPLPDKFSELNYFTSMTEVLKLLALNFLRFFNNFAIVKLTE